METDSAQTNETQMMASLRQKSEAAQAETDRLWKLLDAIEAEMAPLNERRRSLLCLWNNSLELSRGLKAAITALEAKV